ncbi:MULTISPECIES: HAD family hydrolase [Clostridium]|uniref:Haloacid dehalogenase-like hydrolase n=1 Tax=Clostridium ragsdalei P11 TaxID=1353534 RepID=A0A1A6AME6_9CLOT|nr:MULTISPECIES: HAD family hydrolase [Clostridium]OBR91235.1 hypothetical protein CLRAG_31770 [Clostridium ragsdalei P11]QXE17543.1 ATPase P [Clostridium sp. 001]
MIMFDIPGSSSITIKNVIFDFNGTLGQDGILIDSVGDKLKELAGKDVNIYVITADTYGTVKNQCQGLPVKVKVFNKEDSSKDKKYMVEKLGCDVTASVGNGRNDLEMFKSSIISICVIGREGCFTKSLIESDIAVTNILDAVDLLLNNDRIRATLRT